MNVREKKKLYDNLNVIFFLKKNVKGKFEIYLKKTLKTNLYCLIACVAFL